MPRFPIAPAVLAVALLGALLAAACGPRVPERTFLSHVILEATPTPGFMLSAADGSRVSLDDFKGRVVVLYFGYTHCPDVCPTTVASFAAAFERLPEAIRRDLRFVMVTVDPKRDTPEVMGRYVSHFSPEFVGLSGTQAEIDDVIRQWQLQVECGEVAPDGSYSVGHPASAWVLDRDGRQRLHMSFGTPPDAIASDLQLLVTKGSHANADRFEASRAQRRRRPGHAVRSSLQRQQPGQRAYCSLESHEPGCGCCHHRRHSCRNAAPHVHYRGKRRLGTFDPRQSRRELRRLRRRDEQR